ncbi:MAG: thiamine pyrophosphate-binding protein [Bryobacteraceae bacterium]
MKVAERIMEEARQQGLRHCFGLPGGGAPLEMIEAGFRRGIEFVPTANESSAAIIGGYYGLMKGTAGLALAVRGVGAGNLVGGLLNAHFERLPVVAVCEAVPTGWGDWAGVQRCDQESLFAPAAKYQTRLAASNAEEVLRTGFRIAAAGRPGPVALELPGDADSIAGSSSVPDVDPPPSAASTADLQQAREFLARCSRPAVIAGADVVRGQATGELKRFVEATGAVVLVTMEARGVFPESHPRWAGVLMGSFAENVVESRVLEQADGVVFAGADAMMTHVPWKPRLPACELAASARYRAMHPDPAVRVNGDLKAILRDLTPSPPRAGFSEDEIQRLRDQILAYFRRPAAARFAAQDVIEITRRLLPPEGILISETGVYVCMLEHLWLVDRPGTYFGTSGGRTMGLTLPAAIGARLADPVTPMVGIGGDGSLLMRLGELETLARTGVALPLVIINDQALGTIKWRQKARGYAEHGLSLHPVDLAGVATACGLHGALVQTPEEYESALRAALRSDRTTLIDARVDPGAYQDSFGPTIGVV